MDGDHCLDIPSSLISGDRLARNVARTSAVAVACCRYLRG